MANSGMNPIIYAWKNTNFRRAFGRFLKCKRPDSIEPSQSIRSNLHRKSSSNQHHENGPNYSTPPPLQRQGTIVPKTIPEITFAETSSTQTNELDEICVVPKINLSLNNNEITMANIIINKCALLENLENIKNDVKPNSNLECICNQKSDKITCKISEN